MAELAELLDAKLTGDGQCEITGLATLQNAKSGQLSFLSNPSYVSQLKNSKASAILIDEKYLDSCPCNKLVTLIPYVSFAKATALFDNSPLPPTGVHESASVDASAVLGKNVSISANAVIAANVSLGDDVVIGAGCYVGENVSLGKACKLHSNVTLYHGVVLGKNVKIHSGSVVGADGFGFAFDDSKSVKIHQLGGVKIGDDVEIGAGSVTIGKYCIMGGGSGVVGHISIADRVQVSAMSLLSQSISEPGIYSTGTIQAKTSQWKRNAIRFQQLDSIAKRLKEIESSTDKQ